MRMSSLLYKILLIICILSGISYADERIVDFSDDSVNILNEELRQVRQNTTKINDGVYKTSDTMDIVAATGITVTKKIMRIQGSGGAVNISANPQIVDGVDGQTIILQGDSDANTVQLDDGTGLQLAGAASFTMGKGDIIGLTYDEGDDLWIECFRSNN